MTKEIRQATMCALSVGNLRPNGRIREKTALNHSVLCMTHEWGPRARVLFVHVFVPQPRHNS